MLQRVRRGVRKSIGGVGRALRWRNGGALLLHNEKTDVVDMVSDVIGRELLRTDGGVCVASSPGGRAWAVQAQLDRSVALGASLRVAVGSLSDCVSAELGRDEDGLKLLPSAALEEWIASRVFSLPLSHLMSPSQPNRHVRLLREVVFRWSMDGVTPTAIQAALPSHVEPVLREASVAYAAIIASLTADSLELPGIRAVRLAQELQEDGILRDRLQSAWDLVVIPQASSVSGAEWQLLQQVSKMVPTLIALDPDERVAPWASPWNRQSVLDASCTTSDIPTPPTLPIHPSTFPLLLQSPNISSSLASSCEESMASSQSTTSSKISTSPLRKILNDFDRTEERGDEGVGKSEDVGGGFAGVGTNASWNANGSVGMIRSGVTTTLAQTVANAAVEVAMEVAQRREGGGAVFVKCDGVPRTVERRILESVMEKLDTCGRNDDGRVGVVDLGSDVVSRDDAVSWVVAAAFAALTPGRARTPGLLFRLITSPLYNVPIDAAAALLGNPAKSPTATLEKIAMDLKGADDALSDLSFAADRWSRASAPAAAAAWARRSGLMRWIDEAGNAGNTSHRVAFERFLQLLAVESGGAATPLQTLESAVRTADRVSVARDPDAVANVRSLHHITEHIESGAKAVIVVGRGSLDADVLLLPYNGPSRSPPTLPNWVSFPQVYLDGSVSHTPIPTMHPLSSLPPSSPDPFELNARQLLATVTASKSAVLFISPKATPAGKPVQLDPVLQAFCTQENILQTQTPTTKTQPMTAPKRHTIITNTKVKAEKVGSDGEDAGGVLLSHSRLFELEWCKYRFFLSRKLGSVGVPSAAARYGQALHVAMEAAGMVEMMWEFGSKYGERWISEEQENVASGSDAREMRALRFLSDDTALSAHFLDAGSSRLPPHRDTFLSELLWNVFDVAWGDDGGNDGEQERALRLAARDATKAVAMRMTSAHDSEVIPVAVEASFSVPLTLPERGQLRGIIDRIEIPRSSLPPTLPFPSQSSAATTTTVSTSTSTTSPIPFSSPGAVIEGWTELLRGPGGYAIRDYKTAVQWRKPNALESDVRTSKQLVLYAMAATSMTGTPPTSLVLESVEDGKVAKRKPPTSRAIASAQEKLRALIAASKLPADPSHFPASPAPAKCNVCNFKDACRYSSSG